MGFQSVKNRVVAAADPNSRVNQLILPKNVGPIPAGYGRERAQREKLFAGARQT